MPRIRQFKPEFWADEKMAGASRDARLLFFGLLTEADDEGRLVDSPKRLAGCVFPFDEDVTAKKVERWLDELVERNSIVRYSADGARYLWVRNFKKHQKVAHPRPSSLPHPPAEPPDDHPPNSRQPRESLLRDSGAPHEVVTPGLGVKGSRSSSSSERGDDEEEDFVKPDEPDNEVLAVCRRVAELRLAATSETIVQPEKWLVKVTSSVFDECRQRIQDRLADGVSPGQIAADLGPKKAAPKHPDEPKPAYFDRYVAS